MGKFIHSIKQNRFIRGLYYLYIYYFGYSRKSFGYIADNVTITPPFLFQIQRMFFYMVIMD